MHNRAADKTLPEDGWMPACEALALVIARIGESCAHQAITQRCAAGLIAARATLLLGETQDARTRRTPFRDENAPIPEKFWWANGEAALDQDWEAGDFSTWIDNVQWRAFGVEFDRASIERLAPIRAKTAAFKGADNESEAAPQPAERALPSDDRIKAKMIELYELGANRDLAAKLIRTYPGFESVQNEHARRVIQGHLPRGRPKNRQNK